MCIRDRNKEVSGALWSVQAVRMYGKRVFYNIFGTYVEYIFTLCSYYNMRSSRLFIDWQPRSVSDTRFLNPVSRCSFIISLTVWLSGILQGSSRENIGMRNVRDSCESYGMKRPGKSDGWIFRAQRL